MSEPLPPPVPLTFENRDGLPIRGDLHRPAGRAARPLVLVAHGFKGFKDWGFFPFLAESLAGAGLPALRFNFARNGVGEGGTEFDRLDLFEENSVSREIRDLEDLLDALPGRRELSGVPVDRVGLVGHSRGGAVGILFGAGEPRVASLVTWAAVARFGRHFPPEVLAAWKEKGVHEIENARTKQMMPLGMDFYRDLAERAGVLDVEAAEARLEAPHLVVHGEEDEAVPVEDAHAIAQASGGRAHARIVPGAGHTFGAVHPFGETTDALEAAISATVGHLRETLPPPAE